MVACTVSSKLAHLEICQSTSRIRKVCFTCYYIVHYLGSPSLRLTRRTTRRELEFLHFIGSYKERAYSTSVNVPERHTGLNRIVNETYVAGIFKSFIVKKNLNGSTIERRHFYKTQQNIRDFRRLPSELCFTNLVKNLQLQKHSCLFNKLRIFS